MIEFKEHLLKNGKSQRTVNAIISCIRGYFDFLILNEVVKVNPVSKLLTIKVTEYRQNRLTDNQINDFYMKPMIFILMEKRKYHCLFLFKINIRIYIIKM